MRQAIRKLARIASKVLNPKYAGVFFKNGKIIATDTFILVELEGKQEDDAVVPASEILQTEFKEDEPLLAQIEKRLKEELPKYEPMFDNDPETEMMFDVHHLVRAVDALDSFDDGHAVMKVPRDKNKPLVIELANKKGRALIMGIKSVKK